MRKVTAQRTMTWASNQYLVLQRQYLWQRFADDMMEEKYREEFWVKNMRHALNILIGLTMLVLLFLAGETILETFVPTFECHYPNSKLDRSLVLVVCLATFVPSLFLRQTWKCWMRFWMLANTFFGAVLILLCIFFVVNNVYPFSPSCSCVRQHISINDDFEWCEKPSGAEQYCRPHGWWRWEFLRSSIDCSLYGSTSNQVQIIFLLFLPRLIPIFKYAHYTWLYFIPWLAVTFVMPFIMGLQEKETSSQYIQKAAFSFAWLFMANAVSINHKFMLEKSQRKQFSSAVQDQSVLLRLFDILRFMLPSHILHRQLANPNTIIADHVDFCSILFCCIDEIDVFVNRFSPSELLEFLNGYFTSFDELCAEYEVTKMETIGEVYVCAVGLTPQDMVRHRKVGHSVNLERLLHVGLEMLTLQTSEVTFKIGLHTGPIVAGVVGTKLPRYRLFGDTINTAARMEQKGFKGEVNFSSETLKFVPAGFDNTWKGNVEMKGKGQVDVYVLDKPAINVSPTARLTQNRTSKAARGLVNHLVEGPAKRMSDLVRCLEPHLPGLVKDMEDGGVSLEAAVHGARQPPMGILRVDGRRPSYRPHRSTNRPSLPVPSRASMPVTKNRDSQFTFARRSQDLCNTSFNKAQVTFASDKGPESAGRTSYGFGSYSESDSLFSKDAPLNNLPSSSSYLSKDPLLTAEETRGFERHVLEDLTALEDETFREVLTAVVKSEPNVQYMYRQRGCCPSPAQWSTLGKRMRFAEESRENEFQRWYHEKFVVRKIDKRLRVHMAGILVVTLLEATWNYMLPVKGAHKIWGDRRQEAFLSFRGLCIILPVIWWYLSNKPWINRNPLHVQRWLTITLSAVSICLFLSTDALHPYYPGVHENGVPEPSVTDPDLPYEAVRTASFFLQFTIATTQYRLLFRHALLFVPLAAILAFFSTFGCFCIYMYFVSKAAFFCSALLGAFVAHSLEHMSRKRFARDQSRELTRLRVEGTLKTLMPPMVVDELRQVRSMTTTRPHARSSVASRRTTGSIGSASDRQKIYSEPSISHEYQGVTILQADLVGFTKLAATKSPQEVLRIVGDLFAIFDDLTDEHGVYKLETVGDAYIAVQGGPPLTTDQDPWAILRLSMAMCGSIAHWATAETQRQDEALASIDCRVGVHYGPVVGGIVGQDMQRYHLFGKTMHVMDLLEATSLPGKVQVSRACKKAAMLRGLSRTYSTSTSVHRGLDKNTPYIFQQRQIPNLSTSKGDHVSFDEVGGKTYFLSHQI